MDTEAIRQPILAQSTRLALEHLDKELQRGFDMSLVLTTADGDPTYYEADSGGVPDQDVLRRLNAEVAGEEEVKVEEEEVVEEEGEIKEEEKEQKSPHEWWGPMFLKGFTFIDVNMDIPLPADADTNTIVSKMANGLLKVTFGKKPPKNIDVSES